MKTFKISVKNRKKLGKSDTKKIRKEGFVPCVMYGGEKNYHFFGSQNDFNKVVFSPDVFMLELDIEGEMHRAIMQEISFHPVTDAIIHIDFVEVFDDKPVIATIPIKLTGASVGIKNGGKLRQKRRYLRVRGLAKDLPDILEIDITNVDISQVIKVGDLNYPNIELLDPSRSMIVAVVSSRVAMKGMTLEEPEAEGEAAEGVEGESTEGDEGDDAESQDQKDSKE